MKSVIIYYSDTGNTKKTAEILKQHLSKKGGVDVIELKSPGEPKSFFGQAAGAFMHKRGPISEVKFDLSEYSLLCFGTPVWAFGPAPAVNTYLDKCDGIPGKSVILFTTYGSGTGNQRCLDYMKGLLAKKGAASFSQFSVQQGRVRDEQFVLSQINEITPHL